MVEIVVTPSSLQSGDAAVVVRSGLPANVVIQEGATLARGTSAGTIAAGNRGLPTGGTSGQALVKSSATDYAVEWITTGIGGGISNVIEDTSPQLGGDLDRNGFNISGLVIGTHVQAYSLVLQNTTASFTLSDETKLDALPDSATLSATLGAKAPLSSPTFSGTPTGPTATPATNSTQLATTAYADAAAALKANIASPTFTGTPLAPTATTGTNTTQVATTAFANATVAAIPGPLEFPIFAGAMLPRLTLGAERMAPFEYGTNKLVLAPLAFDPNVIEYAQIDEWLPQAWNAGTVTAKFIWVHGATTTNFGTVWGIQGRIYNDGDDIDQAMGTAQTVTDTGGVAGKFYISPAVPATTLAGTAAGRRRAIFTVYRNATSGSDNLAVDAWLDCVVLTLTLAANTDA